MTGEQQIVDDRNDELFVGDNYQYYRNQWRGRMGQPNFASWNWPAFIFSIYWLGYRKMYLEAFLFGLLSLFSAIIPGGGLVLHILVGIFANSYYRNKAKKTIEQTSHMTQWEAVQYIKRHGGTNVLSIFVTLLIVVSLAVAVIAGIAFFPTGENETHSQVLQSKTFKTDHFSFTFPEDWKQEKENTSLDLKCLTYDEDLLTGVLDYDKADYTDNFNPEDALTSYIDELLLQHDNPEFIEVMRDEKDEEKRIKTVLYSGELDSDKYYYIISLAEFKDFDKFAIIVQIVRPSQFEKYKSTCEDIVNSCQRIQ
ncbi:DUF2628 domain-containing protein [Lacrimispora amygdalina]|uniref:DUF2628 domain-containing protein n=1 Tax=Lacrimispora amygdalina TaxID=253257 RepID=UPI000BE32078|nr:DUF2628 domain-containing protein [Lacrimispora amygdalina]